MPSTWTLTYCGLPLHVRMTDFGHLGFFAEHGPHWQWLRQQVAAAKQPVRVLNAFAYTGSSTLAAAAAGAQVVHLDAAEGIVAWARENAQLAGLSDSPIRWIVEDVTKFLGREVRRGNRYDAIILDPPSFGRGPKGEVWKLTRDLRPLLELCRQVLSDSPFAVVLSTHTPGISPAVLENLLADAMGLDRGQFRSMEMIVPQSGGRWRVTQRRSGAVGRPDTEMKTPLTSFGNPAVKNLVKLRQFRERARQGMLLIDGARALHMALSNGFPISTVYFSQSVADGQAGLLRGARDAGGQPAAGHARGIRKNRVRAAPGRDSRSGSPSPDEPCGPACC